MWLAVLLTCSGPMSLTCDVLVRTGGMFPTQEDCSKEVKTVANELVNNGLYVKGRCYKLNVGSNV